MRLIAGCNFYTGIQRDDAWRMGLHYRFFLIVIDLDAFDPVITRSEKLTESLVPGFLKQMDTYVYLKFSYYINIYRINILSAL